MTRILIFCFVLLSLSRCNGGNGKRNEKQNSTGISITSTDSLVSNTIGSVKPSINVYIENSGSMDGYVKGITEFEMSVYDYLSDIKISGIVDSLNLFYINSEVIPQGSDIEDFIQKLEPSNFKQKGGNRGKSDIANVIKDVLLETKENNISIVVTDGIFSPGKGVNASEYLVNQQIGIKTAMADYLNKHQNTAVVVSQLSSQFDSIYYDKEDKKIPFKGQRPYYIWLIGDVMQVADLQSKVPNKDVQHVFSITMGNQSMKYALKIGSGKFGLDKSDPKKTMKNLQRDSHRKAVTFAVDCDLSGLLLDETYLSDTSNYKWNLKDYSFSVSKTTINGYSHSLTFSSPHVVKGNLSVKLMSKIPAWVETVNDDDGSAPTNGKTYGVKYQVLGVYEAFTHGGNDFYAEIKVFIK